MSSAPVNSARHCATCRREFEHHQQYTGSPKGLVCRNRKACEARLYRPKRIRRKAA